jgi:hypothetical protein
MEKMNIFKAILFVSLNFFLSFWSILNKLNTIFPSFPNQTNLAAFFSFYTVLASCMALTIIQVFERYKDRLFQEKN